MKLLPPTPEQWTALVAAVETDQGGLLPDKCFGEYLTYPDPNEESGPKTTTTCQCKKTARFAIVYDPSEPTEFDSKPVKKEVYAAMIERGGGYATVCGICDGVGHWPKYNYVLEA